MRRLVLYHQQWRMLCKHHALVQWGARSIMCSAAPAPQTVSQSPRGCHGLTRACSMPNVCAYCIQRGSGRRQVTGFGYEHDEAWAANLEMFKHFTDVTQGVRRLGAAAVDLCHVALGTGPSRVAMCKGLQPCGRHSGQRPRNFQKSRGTLGTTTRIAWCCMMTCESPGAGTQHTGC